MKKKSIIALALFFVLQVQLTKGYCQKAECIKGNNFQGYIFPDSVYILIGIENQAARFTPAESAIRVVENELRFQLSKVTSNLPDFGPGCPEINTRNLKKYYRQYFGFITSEGERVIFIDFIWHKGLGIERLDTDLVSVYDGCTFYWSIQYNLNTETFGKLKVNTRS